MELFLDCVAEAERLDYDPGREEEEERDEAYAPRGPGETVGCDEGAEDDRVEDTAEGGAGCD